VKSNVTGMSKPSGILHRSTPLDTEFPILQNSKGVSCHPRKVNFPSVGWPWRWKYNDPPELRLLFPRRHELAPTRTESSSTSIWKFLIRNVHCHRFLNTQFKMWINIFTKLSHQLIHSFISIQPWKPGLAGTRAQSCDRYGSGTLHPGQVLLGVVCHCFPPPLDVPTLVARYHRPQRCERS